MVKDRLEELKKIRKDAGIHDEQTVKLDVENTTGCESLLVLLHKMGPIYERIMVLPLLLLDMKCNVSPSKIPLS